MSAATARKPAPPGTPVRDPVARVSSPASAAARRTATPPAAAGTNGVARTGSARSRANGTPVSARAAARRPTLTSKSSSMSASQADSADEEAREEQAVLMADLRERLQKAETEADERQKQVDVLTNRLDEALKEQAKLEERAHEEEEKVESLEADKQRLTRQQRELEGIYEAERAQAMKDKEEAQGRVEELQETIKRLKEAIAKRSVDSDGEEGSPRKNPSRSSSTQNVERVDSFAPPSTVQRSDSRNHSKLIHQKDQIIEDLRLELAELQIKMMEMDNAGGGRMRELERQMVDIRMANARLIEDNESFQLLLGEKTLNGTLSRADFLRPSSAHSERAPSINGPLNSLADELGDMEHDDGEGGETVRKLEHEINTLKDSNKALTLYINKIIGRLLQHQGFESVLGEDKDATPNTNKELPPPPPPKENDQPAESGFLQRAKSVMGGGGGGAGGRNKPRPFSYQAQRTTMNQDPDTAPRIPLQRSQTSRASSSEGYHRRSTSEIRMGPPGSIANMFRPPPVAGTVSPGLVSPRNSFFPRPINSNPSSRVPSSGAPPRDDDSSSDVRSTSDASHVDTPSPPRPQITSTMTGKQMRPLRLVQNSEEEQRARKAANRQTWFGGLFGNSGANANAEQKGADLS